METRIQLPYQVKKKLKALTRGSTPARVAKRAQILLWLNRGTRVAEVAEALECGTATVKRVRRFFLKEGWERAVQDAPRPGRPAKLSTRQEKELIALACTDPPDGHARWTIRLLMQGGKNPLSYGTVRRTLQRDGLKPWREKNVVCPESR